MITYYASTRHGNTITKFVEDSAPELADQIRFVGYSTLDPTERPLPGLHIFTDFERLEPEELSFVGELRDWIGNRPRRFRVLGNPDTWLDRHTLLGRLHAAGINSFRARHVDELDADIRFPVFLRWADQHRGSIGPPVTSRTELEARVSEVLTQRGDTVRTRKRLLVVEQLDTRGPDGWFRKYSVLRVGDAYIPRHLYFSPDWVTRMPDHVDARTAAEEDAFIANPADLDIVREAFTISGIEFGRIDYGYVDGKLQVWEINTNPMVGSSVLPHELRVASQQASIGWVKDALRSATPTARWGRRLADPTPEQLARWRSVMERSLRHDQYRH